MSKDESQRDLKICNVIMLSCFSLQVAENKRLTRVSISSPKGPFTRAQVECQPGAASMP